MGPDSTCPKHMTHSTRFTAIPAALFSLLLSQPINCLLEKCGSGSTGFVIGDAAGLYCGGNCTTYYNGDKQKAYVWANVDVYGTNGGGIGADPDNLILIAYVNMSGQIADPGGDCSGLSIDNFCNPASRNQCCGANANSMYQFGPGICPPTPSPPRPSPHPRPTTSSPTPLPTSMSTRLPTPAPTTATTATTTTTLQPTPAATALTPLQTKETSMHVASPATATLTSATSSDMSSDGIVPTPTVRTSVSAMSPTLSAVESTRAALSTSQQVELTLPVDYTTTVVSVVRSGSDGTPTTSSPNVTAISAVSQSSASVPLGAIIGAVCGMW
jgi:hypothetical protein